MMKTCSEMECISCNRILKEGIVNYQTDAGPVCVVCHDNEMEAIELKLMKSFQESSHPGVKNDQDETNQG